MSKIAFIWCVLILVALPASFVYEGKRPFIDYQIYYQNNPGLVMSADVSFDKPAPVNTNVHQISDMEGLSFGDEPGVFYTLLFNTDMTVKEVVRGTSAYELLQKADPQVAPAPDGYDYLLVKVYVRYSLVGPTLAVPRNYPWKLNNSDFYCDSSTKEVYPAPNVTFPSPNLLNGISIQNGENSDFWVVFQVAQTDLQPRMNYYTGPNGDIDYWFALYK